MAEVRQRRRKTYYPRVDPFERYNNQKFSEHYRLSKDLVQEIARDFEASGYSSTALSTKSGALSFEERVSVTELSLKLIFIVILSKKCQIKYIIFRNLILDPKEYAP